MKKILILLAIFVSVMPVIVSVASADNFGISDTADQTGGLLKKSVAGGGSVEEVVGGVINIALSMVGIIFFLIIVYAGFNWMIARGNDEQITKSKSMIEGAVIGLIIVMAAYAITKFVFDSLDKGATSGPETPPLTDIACNGKADGASCGDLSVCKSGSCVSMCVYQYPAGQCKNVSALCTGGAFTPSLCPPLSDTTIQCCH